MADSLTITDNRTGKTYELPITDGTIKANDLKQIKAAGWKSPPDHPDLDPAHEALQLQEHLQESARLEAAQAYPHDFMEMIHTGTGATESLLQALAAQPGNTTAAARAFDAVARSCVTCHEAYRD